MMRTSNAPTEYNVTYEGKVRDVYDIGFGLVGFHHSNRLSSFDRHVCEVPHKGSYLTGMSEYWFNATRSIIPNHYLWSEGPVMICKKCTPIMLEVVVRGYITGSTSTSLWTHYNKGERTYCGIDFPDGLVKNQKLHHNVVTPTTKGDVDEPISAEEIVSQGYLTPAQWLYVSGKALELFEFGQKVARRHGYILVDTKYEFGFDERGDIILMDEIHTCDSSRFWKASTYQARFDAGESPESIDKDIVRNYIASRCNPYTDDLPDIPQDLITRTSTTYRDFLLTFNPDYDYASLVHLDTEYPDALFGKYFAHVQSIMSKAVIVSGSTSDQEWVEKIKNELTTQGIYCEVHYASAHKNTQLVLDIVKSEEGRVVFIAVAGMTNALGGVIAANTRYPTINCPPFKDKDDMMTNIQSSLQNPSKVPAATILQPDNLALFVRNILKL